MRKSNPLKNQMLVAAKRNRKIDVMEQGPQYPIHDMDGSWYEPIPVRGAESTRMKFRYRRAMRIAFQNCGAF